MPQTISAFADQIAARQYYKKDDNEKPVEDYAGMMRRVARHVARAEAIDAYKRDNGRYPEWYLSFEGRRKNLLALKELDEWIGEQGYAPLVQKWEDEFFELLINQKFTPGGRILAGAESQYGQLLNCFVLGPSGRYIDKAKGDHDSIDGIYELNYKLAKVTKTGGGCGLNLDFMRESGSKVDGSGGRSSGPVSFLRLNYNTTLRVIKLEGVRRGAGMAAMSIWHPDVLDFITAKDHDREAVEGRIEAFNISSLITDEFMKAVEDNSIWHFKSVRNPGQLVRPSEVPGKYHYPEAVQAEGDSEEIPIVDGLGVPARWLWGKLIDHAHRTGDPGVIFIDRINEYWPFRDILGPINATNPCGEQPLFPGEPCCLGSMILDRFVTYTEQGPLFDSPTFNEAVKVAVRFLDNVLTMNVHPIEDTMEWADRLRRIGLGVTGDASMCTMLGLGYGSEEANRLRESIATDMKVTTHRASTDLAVEKGAFPYCEKLEGFEPRRNVHTLTIAPNGTISMVADTSSGIEPIFALAMMRRVGEDYRFRLDPTFEEYLRSKRQDINLDDETQYVSTKVPISYDAQQRPIFGNVLVPEVVKEILNNKGSLKGLDMFSDEEQKLFATTHDITPLEHVKVQAAWQNGFDDKDLMVAASISKTVNLSNDATVEDVRKVYEEGFKRGLKGITIYRDGSRSDQVLRTDTQDEKEEAPEAQEVQIPTPTVGPVLVERPNKTLGGMKKAEFRDAEGKERKAYVYVGTDETNYPVEVFITDEKAGPEVHSYAAALGKTISVSLKFGTPPAQLAKTLIGLQGGSVSFSGGLYQSVPDMVGKLLSEAIDQSETYLNGDNIEYDDDGKEILFKGDASCPHTHTRNEGGCVVCVDCGFSKCM